MLCKVRGVGGATGACCQLACHLPPSPNIQAARVQARARARSLLAWYDMMQELELPDGFTFSDLYGHMEATLRALLGGPAVPHRPGGSFYRDTARVLGDLYAGEDARGCAAACMP